MRGGFRRRMKSGENEEDFDLSKLDKRALKFVYKYLKKPTKTLIGATLAMLVVTLTHLAGPYLMKIAVDDYVLQQNFRGLTLIFFLMVITYGIYWLSSYWQTYLSSYIGQKIIGDIRTDLYDHLQEQQISFFHKRSTGDIMARVTHDVNALSDLVSTGFIHLLNDFFTLIGIIVIMLVLSWQMAIITFITIPFIYLAVSFLGKKMRKAYRDVREKLADLNADVEQNLSGIRLVQALNREAVNTGEFNRLSWENLKANLKAVSIFALLFPTMELSRVLGEALVLWYGGRAIITGTITLGVVMAFFGYVRRFFAPLADLSQVYNTFQEAGAALDRIYEFMEIEPELKDPAEADTEKSPVKVNKKEIQGGIKIDNVSFGYEKEDVLKNLDLLIEPKEVFALVGPTGSGKTTIVNLSTRLYDVDKGEILIDDINLKNIPFSDLREIIGVVPQHVFLFDTTIKENIRYGKPEASDEEVIAVAKKIHAHDFISDLPEGYETGVGEGGVRLSGGQKQLVSFARALLVDPKILILDEATSSVDAYTEVLIQKAMEELLKNRTVLMIAHRFATLKMVKRIGVLEAGVLQEIGTHKELMKTNKTYQELFKKQTGEVA